MQAEGAPLIENGIPHRPGVCDIIHETIRFGEAIDRVQLLTSRCAVLIQRVFQKLIVFGLPHPLGHVDHGGRLVVNQSVASAALLIVDTIGHHVPEGKSPAAAIRVLNNGASLHDDPVLGAQVSIRIVDILGPTLHCLVFTPAGNVTASTGITFTQAIQQIQESVVGLIDLVEVARGNRLGVCAPHGGVVAVRPTGGPGFGVAVEHLLLLLICNAAFRLKLICGGHPSLVMAGRSVIGIYSILHRRARHKLGSIGPHAVVADGL